MLVKHPVLVEFIISLSPWNYVSVNRYIGGVIDARWKRSRFPDCLSIR